MKPDYKKIRDAVFALCERNAKEVSQLYDDAIMEIAQAMKGLEIDENQPFNFEDYGLQDKVDEIMDRLEASITNKVRDGVVAAYGMSYANCEALIKYAVGEHVSDKVMKRFLPKLRAEQAANVFMKNVPTPSGKLWNGETLALMTSAVEDAIKQGMSASKMATQIKKYLLDPDDWHRRFRYKVGEDEEGNSIYGRKWKKREWDEVTKRYYWVDHKPGEPHPGHVGGSGAYRSSYKNALRYARTTTNIAYRTADYDQYQELPFVIGTEIKLSNNHPVPDICDDLAGVYPKDFKWTGWHPNCRCYQVPVLAKMKDVAKMVDAILDDEDPEGMECEGAVTDLPDNFKQWAWKNKERMMDANERGTLPYFIRDNQRMVEKTVGKFPDTIKGEAIAKDVTGKLSKAAEPIRRSLFVSFDPISPAIINAVQAVKGNRQKNEIYESVMTDSRAKVLNDSNGYRTILFPGHRGTVHKSWGPTQQMAFTLNEHGMDVAFLPEKAENKVKYADSLIKVSEKRYFFADFKYCPTTKSNTLGEDLIDGFGQAKTIVLKAPNMDAGRLCDALDQVKRKSDNIGDIIIINKNGKILELSSKDIRNGRYRYKVKGFMK